MSWSRIHPECDAAAVHGRGRSWFADDEKLTGGRLVGVLLGLSGVGVPVGMTMMRSLGTQVTAQLAVLAAALSYAFAGVFGRRFRARGVSPMATATGQVTVSGIVLLPMMLLVDRPWESPGPSLGVVAALGGLAVLSTAVAHIIYFRLLSTAGATYLLLVTFLIPVTAILLGVPVLGEALLPRHLLGMLLIGLGLGATDDRPWRLGRRRLVHHRFPQAGTRR